MFHKYDRMPLGARILALAFFVLMINVSGLAAGEKDGNFDIYWIDTEGGAATLMITPTGESILIDTGNPGPRDPNRIAKVLVQVAKVKQIDHLITTHYHSDHFGGAEMLSTLVKIRNVYDNGRFRGMPNDPGKRYWEFKCEKRHVINPGDKIQLSVSKETKTPLTLTCLGTRKEFVKPEKVKAKENDAITKWHRPKDRDGSDNANSVVMLLKFGDFEFFDGGDLTWNQEFNLIYPHNRVGEVDVYQVTHHGLDSSNNPAILHSLNPTVAVMNNGHKKGCAPNVCADLQDVKSLKAVFQVHKNLRHDGDKNNVQDEHIANLHGPEKCQGHYIKLSVDKLGKSYTVTIPSRKTKKTFQCK